MTALANKAGAINLSQGFPDFDGPAEIRQAAAEAIIQGPNQYAPSSGTPVLRDLVRFCFCKKDETLDKAINRLKRWKK